MRVGELVLSLLRPGDPDALIDESLFADDEFMPYWAQLWPSASVLASVLPYRLDGLRVVELGCGLGVPSLVAASRGGDVVATDWAADAIALLETNAERNGLAVTALRADWRAFEGAFDLVLASDVLYEARNVDPLLELLPQLSRDVLIADPGRPAAAGFFERAAGPWHVEEQCPGAYRLTAR